MRERSLADIWENSPAFRAFRGTDWMREPCLTCPRREIDFGGCRCQAFLLTGDARATDPVCELAPLHHLVEDAVRELTRAFGTKRKGLGRIRRKPLLTIDDPLTAMQFRALDWVMKNGERIAAKRARVQASRKRTDREIFARFPLHFVPTYPGDDALLRNPLFALLRPDLPSVDKTLGDIMRT